MKHPEVRKFLNPQKRRENAAIGETPPLVDRIIYLEGFQNDSLYSSADLSIDADFLPPGVKEVLWVHPINLDFTEVLSRVQSKESYERRMLYSCNGYIRTVQALPQVKAGAEGD